jgi:Flp pilus assembly CpaE family ATPase
MSISNSIYQLLSRDKEPFDPAGSGASVNTVSSNHPGSEIPDSPNADRLSIALIGPDHFRRHEVAGALAQCERGEVREFSSYPPALDDVPRLLEQYHDIIVIDLDSNPEYAIKLVENICATNSATVMVYSAKADREMVVRCMRAGAREYLTLPLEPGSMDEALGRVASSMHPGPRTEATPQSRMLVFLGAKGGSGVTTIACNFAVALAQESGQNTLLIDLGLPMGDAALNLGIVAEYSTDNALLDPSRLDATFLSKLVVKHRSGLFVLAAPSKVPKVQASQEAIEKLITVARQDFDNVIIDVGSRLDLIDTVLFKDASSIYLVTQAGISELRNSNRLISQFFNDGTRKLEVVINRFDPSTLGVTEDQITKALTKPARWKIPDDYSATRQLQNSAGSSPASDSPTSRLIRQMARSVCGLAAIPEKKPNSGIKSVSKPISEKVELSPAQPDIPRIAATITWATPEPIAYGTVLSGSQLNAEASVPGTFAYTPGAGYVLPVGTHTVWVTFTPADNADDSPTQASVPVTVTKATPTIRWPKPGVLVSGTALGAAQLNAATSVPGSFVYKPAAGEVLPAGNHSLTVTFTPNDGSIYTKAQAEVLLTVSIATPSISWPTPAPITCGTPLGAGHLNATASVPGAFVYKPGLGEFLGAGRHTLSVTFTPNDTAGYTSAQAEVGLVVVAAVPTINWPKPASIAYGTELTSAQLNARASVPGTFTYIPAEGSVLSAGVHTPSVLFTPTDSTNYTNAQATISLTVAKTIATLEWATPASIVEGTALEASQLSARASVPGTFAYSPGAGEILRAGKHSLEVAFTPLDTTNYTAAQASVSLTVTKPAPTTLFWPNPATISYGTALGANQLNAKSSVPGSFIYIPAGGDVLTIGRHRLLAIFTPDDTEKFATAQATVVIEVNGVAIADPQLTPAATTAFTPTVAANYMDLPDAGSPASQAANPLRQHGKPETRTYKGATYEKGEDGQWHLQQK